MANQLRRDLLKGHVSVTNDEVIYVPDDIEDNPLILSADARFTQAYSGVTPTIQLLYPALNYLRRKEDIGVPKDTNGNLSTFTTPAQVGIYFFGIESSAYNQTHLANFKFIFTNIKITLNDGTNSYDIYTNLEFDGKDYKQWNNLQTTGVMKWSVINTNYRFQSALNGNGTNVEYEIEVIFDTTGAGNLSLRGGVNIPNSGWSITLDNTNKNSQFIVIRDYLAFNQGDIQ